MKPAKVLFLTNAEAYFISTRMELADRLLLEGVDVYLGCPYGQYYDELINTGIKRIIIPIDRHGINPFRDLLLLLFYVKIIHKIKPDCILTFTIKPNLYGSLAAGLYHCPCISNVSGIGESFQKRNLLNWFISCALRIATKKNKCVFFQNQENMRVYNELGICCSNQQLLPGSGVNLRKYPFIPITDDCKQSIVFLMFGRICRSKGVLEYLEASNRLLNKYHNAECFLVGPNDDDAFYEQMLAHCPNSSRFHLLPEIKASDSINLLARIHCLVNPSYHEGMSNVVLEASAIGRATIVSDISGCKEIVNDGITGFLVKPKNIDALFNAMDKFYNLPFEDKKLMGINARKKVENEFDRNIVIQKYIDMLNC